MKRLKQSGMAVLGAVLALGGCAMELADPSEVAVSEQALSGGGTWATVTPSSGSITGLKEVPSCQISDSKMLKAGGQSSTAVTPTNASNESMIYDAIANTWTAANGAGGMGKDPLPAAVAGGQLIKVPNDDKCLYIGGWNNSGTAVNTIYEYDLSDQDWDTVGITLATARYGFQIAFIDNDYVLVFGGYTGAAHPANIERIKITPAYAIENLEDAGNTQRDLTAGRAYLGVVVIDEPRQVNVMGANKDILDFYVIGGETIGGTLALTTVERIGVRKDTRDFQDRLAIAALPVAKSKLSAFPITGFVPLAGGSRTAARILVTAGNSTTASTATSYAFTLPTVGDTDGTWTAAVSMTSPRIRPETIQVGTNDFAVAGGQDELPAGADEDSVATSQTWDDTSGTWLTEDTMVGNGRSQGFALEYLVVNAGTGAKKLFAANGAKVLNETHTVLTDIESVTP